MSFKLGEIVRTLPAIMENRFQCPTNKRPFASKAEAQAALKKINPGQRRNMRHFRCGYCEQHHLGHRRGDIF